MESLLANRCLINNQGRWHVVPVRRRGPGSRRRGVVIRLMAARADDGRSPARGWHGRRGDAGERGDASEMAGSHVDAVGSSSIGYQERDCDGGDFFSR